MTLYIIFAPWRLRQRLLVLFLPAVQVKSGGSRYYQLITDVSYRHVWRPIYTGMKTLWEVILQIKMLLQWVHSGSARLRVRARCCAVRRPHDGRWHHVIPRDWQKNQRCRFFLIGRKSRRIVTGRENWDQDGEACLFLRCSRVHLTAVCCLYELWDIFLQKQAFYFPPEAF